MSKDNRIRKQPQRYGDTVMDLSGQSTGSEPFADNSFDDKTYSPHSEGHKSNSSHSDSSSIANGNGSVVVMEFDEQFEKIEENSKCKAAAVSQNQQLSPKPSTSRSAAERLTSSPECSFQSETLNYLKMIQSYVTSKFNELSPRIAAIEESLIKNGSLISVKKEAESNEELAIFSIFAESKQMPMKTVEEFKNFENSLDEMNMKTAVSKYVI